MTEYCEHCRRELHPDRIVWLTHRTSTGTYHVPHTQAWLGTDDDQGCFPFGPDCAKKVSVELKSKTKKDEE